MALGLGLFPGTAHLYVGWPLRALVWTAAYLGAALPALLLTYVLWAHSPAVWLWIALGAALFYVACARGPARAARRGQAAPGTQPDLHLPRARPALWSLVAYASLTHVAGSVEVALFRRSFLDDVAVATSQLEPLARRGETVRMVASSYIRPVHDEVVLFRAPREIAGAAAPAASSRASSSRALGRVVALPGDHVSWDGARPTVNGVALDLSGRLARRELEKAGRRTRRRHLLRRPTTLSSRSRPVSAAAAAPAAVPRILATDCAAEPWGPLRVDPGYYWVLPDHGPEASRGDPAAAARVLWLVPGNRLLGRGAH